MMENEPLFVNFKSKGNHSWECQRSQNHQIQSLINKGFWIDKIEEDDRHNILIVAEVYGMTEVSIKDIPGLIFVNHNPKFTTLKFKLQ